MSSKKCNVKSEQLRIDGNKFYTQRSFFEALLKYNESLCYAETGSENLGFAFANRSAVFLEMKLYDKCLNNIELAKQNNYPEKSFEILNKREEKCKEMMKNEKSSATWNFFKLSHPPHKNIPFIADCLEVKISEKYGRHVITNRQLKVGEIIAIERPFCSILLSESKFVQVPERNIYQRCSNCLAENALDLIPCSTCCRGLLKLIFKYFSAFQKKTFSFSNVLFFRMPQRIFSTISSIRVSSH
jgi:SET and MYND domain-containing protein 4